MRTVSKTLKRSIPSSAGSSSSATSLIIYFFFEAAGVTVGPVYDVSQFEKDAHVQERGILVDVEDAEAGLLRMPAPLPRLSLTPAALRHAAPRLGENQAEILEQLSKKADETLQRHSRPGEKLR